MVPNTHGGSGTFTITLEGSVVSDVLLDTDRDGIPDTPDLDADGDGIDDAAEVSAGTNPLDWTDF